MVDQIRFFAGAARVLEGRSAGEYMRGMTSFIRREPIGVVGQVTPWNYPLLMATWKIGPALAAGNTIVLKPSDTTPASTLLMAEVASEFFPPGVFNVICGDRDTGPRARVASDAAAGRDHRLGARGHGGRERGVLRPQARAPRARRQGARDHLRRRRHRAGGRDDRRRRLLQRRPGLHGGDARDRLAQGLRRHRRRARRAGQGDEDRHAGRRGHPLRAAQQHEPVRARRGHGRRGARAMRTSPRAGIASPGPGSSTSRP